MTIFIDNKYTHWYYDIISNAQNQNRTKLKKSDTAYVYYELHHIIPKCLKGSNDSKNLVLLTAKEHFICHLLLTKMSQNKEHKIKMYYALSKMKRKNKNQQRTLTSAQFEMCKSSIQKANSLFFTGKKMNLSEKEKMRRAKSILKTRNFRKNFKCSDDTKLKISGANKGKIPYNKGIPAIKIQCPFCLKLVGGQSNFNRWHNLNCKSITSTSSQ
jgi:hypothetical protein